MTSKALALWAAVAFMSAGYATSAAQTSAKPSVKIFILAGQSNMEGYGGIQTLEELAEQPATAEWLKKIKKTDGSFITRDDVFLYYHRGEEVITKPLTVGQGAGPDRIGPELMFGLTMGDYCEEPVLLIKTAWGGKDLYCDFRPPSAGEPSYQIPGETRALGTAYRQMVAEVHECLDHLDSLFPQFRGMRPEISGLVWFQGWNDFCVDPKIRDQVYLEYGRNFAHLVHDLRAEFKVPNLPVVVGELGVDGEKRAPAEIKAFRAAQAKVADEPELKGTLGYVRTAPYWYDKLDEMPRKLDTEERRVRAKVAAQVREEFKGRPEASDNKRMEELIDAAVDEARKKDAAYLKVREEHDRVISHWECHYWGSARVYSLVGNGLAEAMKGLLPKE